ncbi:MAG: FkbM family methyltransferase [Pseudomonadota bacterium]
MLGSLVNTMLKPLGVRVMRTSSARGFNENGEYKIGYVKTKIAGGAYFVPSYATHRPAVANILNGKLYEPATHVFVEKFFQRSTGSMIHAGTFFGDMLVNFSKSVNATVYAFEPVLENYVLAKLCVEENQLRNVLLTNSALSESITNLLINTSEDANLHAGGASSISKEGVICSALAIDCMNASDIALIQLDVEGHELQALKGAEKTIAQSRPVIAIEDNEKNCGAFLEQHRYEITTKIPGLDIWTPAESEEKKEVVLYAVS